jgi:hypothetical protein
MSNLSGNLKRGKAEFIDGEFIDSVDPELTATNTINSSTRISARELHKYVVGLVGVLMLFLITYPIAMSRVSQKEKFAPYQSHLKSLTPEYQPLEPKVIDR